jgi:phage baseplate assembly protein gpV
MLPEAKTTVNGVRRGIVRDVDAARARLLAEFPWMGPGELGRWAPVAGTYFMPEPGDEVLVAFDQGRLDHPYVIGCLWSNADQPPANDQHMRTIRSVNGHEITIFDPPATGGDSGYVRIRDAHGNSVELANGRITISGVGVIQINAPNMTMNDRVVAPAGPPIWLIQHEITISRICRCSPYCSRDWELHSRTLELMGERDGTVPIFCCHVARRSACLQRKRRGCCRHPHSDR